MYETYLLKMWYILAHIKYTCMRVLLYLCMLNLYDINFYDTYFLNIWYLLVHIQHTCVRAQPVCVLCLCACSACVGALPYLYTYLCMSNILRATDCRRCFPAIEFVLQGIFQALDMKKVFSYYRICSLEGFFRRVFALVALARPMKAARYKAVFWWCGFWKKSSEMLVMRQP